MPRRVLSLSVFGLLLALTAWSHGGGLDSDGGHNNRQSGGYHFHRGPLAGQSFGDKTSALRALRGVKDGSPTKTEADEPEGSTVYVTKTGKKYHRAGCQYLKSSREPLALSDAKRAGYTPCSRCKPAS